MSTRSELTPSQLADLTRDHAAAQEDLDDLIEAHRVDMARHGELLATARLTVHMVEQSHDIAAGFAAHAITRLVQVLAELGDMRPSLSAAEDARDDAQRERDALRAELVGWAELTTVKLTDAGRLHMAEADTGDDQYAVLLSDQPVDEAAASEAYRQRGEGDGG